MTRACYHEQKRYSEACTTHNSHFKRAIPGTSNADIPISSSTPIKAGSYIPFSLSTDLEESGEWKGYIYILSRCSLVQHGHIQE